MLICDTLTSRYYQLCTEESSHDLKASNMFRIISTKFSPPELLLLLNSLCQLLALSSNKVYKSGTLKVIRVTWGSLLFILSWFPSASDLTSGTHSLIFGALTCSSRWDEHQLSPQAQPLSSLSSGCLVLNSPSLIHSPHCGHDDLSEA